MKRTLTLISAFVLAMSMMVLPALAQNPHYVGGPNFSFDGSQVTVTGSVAGLGNQNIDVRLTVSGEQTVQCRNPGGNIAPGQTQDFDVSTTQENLEVRNGRVNYSISSGPLGFTEQELRDARACPNARWTPLPGPVTVTSATVEIIQPTGSNNVVLSNTHTF